MTEEIRLIALDLDHTLLDSAWKLPEKNRAAILKVAERGIPIALASGRKPSAIRMIADELEETVRFIISYNGARAGELHSEELLHHTPIARGEILPIVSQAYSLGQNLVFFSGDRVFPLTPNKEIDAVLELYSKRTKATYCFLESPEVIPDLDFEKFFIYDPLLNRSLDPEEIQAHELKIADHYSRQVGSALRVLRTRLGYIEIINSETSKLSAIRAVSNQLGLKLQNVLAIGDGYNDVEMIRECGYGVAVGNAVTPAKEAAKLVVASNDEAGVAEALNSYLPLME